MLSSSKGLVYSVLPAFYDGLPNAVMLCRGQSTSVPCCAVRRELKLLVALTSAHIVPEMIFASTPLKCLRELDGARADIPEKDSKSIDVHGIIVLSCSKDR